MISPPPLALLGSSEAAQRAREMLDRAAASDTHLLIESEPGCRPGEIAQAVHQASRLGHPFVAVSASGGPPATAESPLETADLFGSADVVPGELELIGADAALLRAGGGTLYIEELGDLPASSQRRLSRVLRDGEVVAGGERRRLTCRVVACMSAPAGDEREPGVREDLLRRFGRAPLTVPPLRQRPGDIGAIVERLAAPHARQFTQAAVTVLAALPWPRNVDELAATVAALMESGAATIQQEDVLARLPIEGAFQRVDPTLSLKDARRRFERDYIAAVLERHHWRMSEAARALGIERANLYRKARQLGIQKAPRAEAS